MRTPTVPRGRPPRYDLPVPETAGRSAAVDVEHSRAAEAEAEVVAAIEAILVWSRQALSGLIGLGELTRYLGAGGPLELVTTRLHYELERTQTALAELPKLLDRLRRASQLGATRR